MREPLIELVWDGEESAKLRVAGPKNTKRSPKPVVHVEPTKIGEPIRARTVQDIEDQVIKLQVFPLPNAFKCNSRKKYERQTEVQLYYLNLNDYQAALDYLEHVRVNRVLWH